MILVKPSFEIRTPICSDKVLMLIEKAGRTCYKSETNITHSSASAFVKKIVKQGHLSVIEHVSITVKFICDRGVTHEMVRHRLASYSQESTRYCNYSGGVTFVIPPWVKGIGPGEYDLRNPSIVEEIAVNPADWAWLCSIAACEEAYLKLLKKGWTPQQARLVLPNSLKTEIVMTANLREWLHVFNLRCSEKAHPQIREVMIPLREEFRKALPEIYG